MINIWRATAYIVLIAGWFEPAWADLQPRLGGAAVYDSNLNVTWLANANLAATNAFGTPGINPGGLMTLTTAQNWIASINLAKYLGFSNWRLPATPMSDASCIGGYGCTGNEMGYLFYVELGGQETMSITAAHNANYSLFSNLQGGTYWSSESDPAHGEAWTFSFGNGGQGQNFNNLNFLPWPVLTGDVGASSVLPQFAFGGGWYSALYFTNTTANSVSFPINFISDAGTPLNVPSLGGSSTTINLPAGGTTIVEAPNNGTLNQGYVSLSLPVGVEAYGAFRQSVPGEPAQEAVVPLASAFSSSTTLIWDDTNSITTAVAIVNPSNVATTVAIRVVDANGALVGTASVVLPANQKMEGTLESVIGLPGGLAGKRGSVSFTVTSGAVAVLGLRFAGAALTSIPASQK
jgi:Protein of unknown function (DUF1566)